MPRFGFSAFLKLIHLSERAQRTSVRQRLSPTGDGYDFHRSLRSRISRWLMRGASFDEVVASCEDITRIPERKACLAALGQLAVWRASSRFPLIPLLSTTYHSPSNLFSVVYQPDIGAMISGRLTAIHVWNTQKPILDDRFVYASLSLIAESYADGPVQPDDVALLSLRNGRLYSLVESRNHRVLAARIVDLLEGRFLDEAGELKIPPRDDDRPDPASPLL